MHNNGKMHLCCKWDGEQKEFGGVAGLPSSFQDTIRDRVPVGNASTRVSDAPMHDVVAHNTAMNGSKLSGLDRHG